MWHQHRSVSTVIDCQYSTTVYGTPLSGLHSLPPDAGEQEHGYCSNDANHGREEYDHVSGDHRCPRASLPCITSRTAETCVEHVWDTKQS